MTSLSPEMTGETTGYTISIHFKWFANVCADHLGWDLPLAWGSRSRQKDLASKKNLWSLRKSQLGHVSTPCTAPFFRPPRGFLRTLAIGWMKKKTVPELANSQ